MFWLKTLCSSPAEQVGEQGWGLVGSGGSSSAWPPRLPGKGLRGPVLQKNLGAGSLENGCKLRGARGRSCLTPCACGRADAVGVQGQGQGQASALESRPQGAGGVHAGQGAQAGRDQGLWMAPGGPCPWPGKAQSFRFPGPGPSWPCRAPLSSTSRAHRVCHLALGLGLRPVGTGNDMVRSSPAGATPWCPRLGPQASAVPPSPMPSGLCSVH